MATNTFKKNKRVATKHIRDGIKSKYNRGSCCEICGTTQDLEFHHYNSVSLLLKQYASENGIPISTDEEVLAMRDDFYKLFMHELIDDAATLCNRHHLALHKVYSQEPPLHTAAKQRKWVAIQQSKEEGTYTNTESGLSRFIVPDLDLATFMVN